MRPVRQALLAVAAALLLGGWARADEPGWSGGVIARGARRDRIKSTHILLRDYRPFHFYGNIVRRRYYRGRTLPSAGDMVRSTLALLFLRRS